MKKKNNAISLLITFVLCVVNYGLYSQEVTYDGAILTITTLCKAIPNLGTSSTIKKVCSAENNDGVLSQNRCIQDTLNKNICKCTYNISSLEPIKYSVCVNTSEQTSFDASDAYNKYWASQITTHKKNIEISISDIIQKLQKLRGERK